MAPEWEAKEPRESWADAHVLGFQCVLRGGLSKGPGGRAVSVTVIFMFKMHDDKYKKCKSEMQTSAFCMCFQMISPTAQHCLGVQKVLTQGCVHRWPFAMPPPPSGLAQLDLHLPGRQQRCFPGQQNETLRLGLQNETLRLGLQNETLHLTSHNALFSLQH